MTLKELVYKNRTYRRFYEDRPVCMQTLRELADLARMTPSGMNRQGLKYLLSNTPEQNALIFPNLVWAKHLPDWDGPEPGERPAAYVVMVHDTSLGPWVRTDEGIAAQTMLLGAVERGFGGCMFESVHREALHKALGLDPACEIIAVLALGVPKETVVVEPVPESGDMRYWREADGSHHVPKRTLEDILL